MEKVDSQASDCIESPNPILPAVNEIIWGGLAFLIVLAALWKWGVPALKTGMNDRSERIRSDLESQATRPGAEAERADVEAQLARRPGRGRRIIEEARRPGRRRPRRAQRRAEVDIAELRARAETEVDAVRAAAQADVRAEVARWPSAPPSSSSAASWRTRHPGPADRGLHQPSGIAVLRLRRHVAEDR